MNKQATQMLYIDLLYSYEPTVSYGTPKSFFFRPDGLKIPPPSIMNMVQMKFRVQAIDNF